MRHNIVWFIGLVLLFGCGAAHAKSSSHDQIISLVEQIRRADYEGDRAALLRFYRALGPYVGGTPKSISARVLYWRGFALWRRAINGFNDGTSRSELRTDLQKGAEEFKEAARRDPAF